MEIKSVNEIVEGQFGASIEMLENVIKVCPEKLFGDRSNKPEYWYLVYHTIFWLDFYLSESPDSFYPPPPFTLTELDPEGVLPERVYTKSELVEYLEHGRVKLKSLLKNLSEESIKRHYKYGSVEMSFGELIIYNLRHVQHGVEQLNLILHQKIDIAPGWVKRCV